jgi:hypothetical protein
VQIIPSTFANLINAFYPRHFSYEFVWFLRTAGLLDIRYKPPIFVFAKLKFFAEISHWHDRVTSVFADHYIPLWPKQHDRVATLASCHVTVFSPALCFFTVKCSFFPHRKKTVIGNTCSIMIVLLHNIGKQVKWITFFSHLKWFLGTDISFARSYDNFYTQYDHPESRKHKISLSWEATRG